MESRRLIVIPINNNSRLFGKRLSFVSQDDSRVIARECKINGVTHTLSKNEVGILADIPGDPLDRIF